MKKILLMSVFVSLLVFSGINNSFASDYDNGHRQDYNIKDGKYDHGHFKHHYKNHHKHDLKHGYHYSKYDKHRYHDNHNHGYNHSYNSYSKFYHHRYRYDNGNHYGHIYKRNTYDHDIWDTFFLGLVFR